jgi:hypothetical protein
MRATGVVSSRVEAQQALGCTMGAQLLAGQEEHAHRSATSAMPEARRS